MSHVDDRKLPLDIPLIVVHKSVNGLKDTVNKIHGNPSETIQY